MTRSKEERKSKGRLLTRVSFRYLDGERNIVLLEIHFGTENQYDIVWTVKKLSDLMHAKYWIITIRRIALWR